MALLVPLQAFVITHFVSQREYAIYSLYIVTVGGISTAAGQFLQQAIGRYLPGYSERVKTNDFEDTITSLALIISFLCLILGLGLFKLTSISGAIAPSMYALGAGTVAVSILLQCSTSILQANKHATGLVWTKCLLPVALICGIFLTGSQNGVSALGLGVCYFVGTVLACAFSFYKMPKAFKRFRIRFPRLRDVLHYGAPMTIWFAMWSSLIAVDKYILKAFGRLDDVAGVSINWMIASGICAIVASPLLSVFQTSIVEQWNRGDTGASCRAVGRVIRILISITTCGVTLIVALRGIGLDVVMGGNWGNDYISFSLAFAAAMLLQISAYCHKLLELTGRLYLMIIVLIAALALNAGSNYLLIPRIGVRGCFVSLFVSYLLYDVLCFYLGNRAPDKRADLGVRLSISGRLIFGSLVLVGVSQAKIALPLIFVACAVYFLLCARAVWFEVRDALAEDNDSLRNSAVLVNS